jgi:hypothetical protein
MSNEWKLVPVEPTHEMLKAWLDAPSIPDHELNQGNELASLVPGYRAMLNAVSTAHPSPVVWQEASEEGEPLWHENSFGQCRNDYDYAMPLYYGPQPDRLAALEAAMDGVTQEMLDGGWNARSLSKYAKSLEERIDFSFHVRIARLLAEMTGDSILSGQQCAKLFGIDLMAWREIEHRCSFRYGYEVDENAPSAEELIRRALAPQPA